MVIGQRDVPGVGATIAGVAIVGEAIVVWSSILLEEVANDGVVGDTDMVAATGLVGVTEASRCRNKCGGRRRPGCI